MDIKLKENNMPTVDILPVLSKQFEILKILQEKMLIELFSELLEQFEFVCKFINHQQDSFLTKDGQIINSPLNVANRFYIKLATLFVYEENYLHSKNLINDFFVKLSYLYYRQPNMIYNPKK